MENTMMNEERVKLQKVFMEKFGKEVQVLSPELQSILFDDLVTAFYSRLNVMKKINSERSF